MGYAPTSCPTTRCLEDAYYPDPVSLALKGAELLGVKTDDIPREVTQNELEEFRGPF